MLALPLMQTGEYFETSGFAQLLLRRSQRSLRPSSLFGLAGVRPAGFRTNNGAGRCRHKTGRRETGRACG